ncbi:hypothetical protein DFH27DRAFT_566227 [Peziza echinospora]|nr:hypothetical protein DFH27DRAFT_566227 [Peziza echinospora]
MKVVGLKSPGGRCYMVLVFSSLDIYLGLLLALLCHHLLRIFPNYLQDSFLPFFFIIHFVCTVRSFSGAKVFIVSLQLLFFFYCYCCILIDISY